MLSNEDVLENIRKELLMAQNEEEFYLVLNMNAPMITNLTFILKFKNGLKIL